MFQNQKDIPFGIERKLQIQHESCGWTLYSERAHVENIFYSRFNYFMLIFTLFVSVIVAVYVSDDVNHKGCTIFFLSLWGSFILGYLEYTLIKTFKVLELVLKWLDQMYPGDISENYVSPMISKQFDPRKYGKFSWKSTNSILTYIIPSTCFVFMIIVLVFSIFLMWEGDSEQASEIIYDSIQVIN
jgi:hypothetical protein